MEDIVRQVFTCGPKFKQVTNFMWPFKVRLITSFVNQHRRVSVVEPKGRLAQEENSLCGRR
jgi:hypothetical protein